MAPRAHNATAENAEAMRKALARRREVAPMDVGLPKGDGYEVAPRLRADLKGQARRTALTSCGADDGRTRRWRRDSTFT